MNNIIIFADVFDYNLTTDYKLLSEVWEYSAKKNNPNAKVILHRIKPPDLHGVPKRCMISNTVKIEDWVKVMNENKELNFVFMDCDMLVLKDLSPVFDKSFDIAVTKHSIGRLPYNGGVVFVKNTPEARMIMELWAKINRKMFDSKDRSYHARYVRKYAGMNQAAFGALIEEYGKYYYTKKENKKEGAAHILELPCSIYNLCRGYWQNVNETSMIIHIKSELRSACLRDRPDKETEACFKLWKQYKQEGNFISDRVTTYPDKIQKNEKCRMAKKVISNSFKYNGGYDQYLKAQISATHIKAPMKNTWAIEENIKFLAQSFILQLIKNPTFAICHGSRNGLEQSWFRKYMKGCDVIGTELCPDLKGIPHTIIWDFNQANQEWIGKADFIYTNSFDHVFNPEETLKIWLSQLKPHGRLIIEYTIQHELTKPTEMDPYKFSRADLITGVKLWTNETYYVQQFLKTPVKKSIAKKPYMVEYAIIEKVDIKNGN